VEFAVQIALGMEGAGFVEAAFAIGQVADKVVPNISIGF